MNRRKSREVATQLVFETLINNEGYMEKIECFKENTDEKIDYIDFGYK